MSTSPKGAAYARWLQAQAARRDQIKALAAAGTSYSEIARRFNISRQRARELATAN